MKKTIQLILELDNEEDVPFKWIKKDLTSQINSAGFYYEVKKCVEIEPDKNKNDKLISMMAAIDALDEQIELCNKALGSFNISTKDEYAIKVERASLKAYREQLGNLPLAQPEIIRCGDCLMHEACRFEIGLGENGFCSQGRRKEE